MCATGLDRERWPLARPFWLQVCVAPDEAYEPLDGIVSARRWGEFESHQQLSERMQQVPVQCPRGDEGREWEETGRRSGWDGMGTSSRTSSSPSACSRCPSWDEGQEWEQTGRRPGWDGMGMIFG